MIYTEARFYKTGWSFRIGAFNLRYNKQQNYTELTLGRVKPGYLSSGGMTWREFRLARKRVSAAGHSYRSRGLWVPTALPRQSGIPAFAAAAPRFYAKLTGWASGPNNGRTGLD